METTSIKITNATKTFGSFTAIRNLNLEITEGEIFTLLGPNGAGKTTTIKMIIGLVKPSSGKINIFGKDVQENLLEIRKNIGLLPDSPFIYPKLTGTEYLRFIGDVYGVETERQKKRIPELLEMFDLEDAGDNLIETYSQGMRQKIVIAGILLHEPKILLLDEPIFGLDPKIARLVKDIILELSRRKTTIFMSTHILELAEKISTRIGIINRGELIALGSKEELRENTKNTTLENIYLQLTGNTEYSEVLKYL